MRNNKRLIIALTGAVVFGLAAVMLVTQYLSNAQAYEKSLNNVVVAKAIIPVGAKITAEQLTLTPIPNGSMPPGAFNDPAKVVGRVAVIPVGAMEPVTEFKIAAEGVGGGLPAVIPDGFRAVTVKVDEVVGVSGFIMPGSFVDVVAVITPTDQQNNGPISKIVLQSIKVLASGASIDQPKDGRETNKASAVTLQVTPEQAEKLVLASNEGKLQLVMRSYSDQDDAATRGANKNSLLTGGGYVPQPDAPKAQPAPKPADPVVVRPRAPRPAPAPRAETRAVPAPPAPPRDAVEMIEGAKKRNVEFP